MLESCQAPGSEKSSSVSAVLWIVESERHAWEIVGRNKPPVLVGEFSAEQTQSDQPWTSVNNCTRKGVGNPQSENYCAANSGTRLPST